MIKAIRHYQQNNGLEVYGYCIMTSHVHLIIRTNENQKPEDLVRALKGYTSRTFHNMLEEKNNTYESRRTWLLWLMKRASTFVSNTKGFQFWQQHNQPIEIWSNEVFEQKLTYIHLNPVVAGFVDQPEHWLYSSARDYAGMKGFLDLASD